jgi:hypothetical protein
MVEVEWRLPLMRVWVCPYSSSIGNYWMDNLRSGGALRWKMKIVGCKGQEWYMTSRHLQGCSPHLCRLRTDGFALVSKFWTYRSHSGDMGPVSLVAGCQLKLAFSPLLQWLIQERSWVRTYGSLSRARGCVGSPSSRGQWICSNLLTTSWIVAICGPREIRMVEGHTRTERGKHVACWSGFPLQGVHRFELPRLSYMSNDLFVAVFD